MIVRTKHYRFYLMMLGGFFFSASMQALAQSAGTPPRIENTGTAPVGYQEDRPAALLLNTVIIADDDSQNMSLATFSFGNGYDAAQDTLVFEETTNIRGHFDETSGTLYLLAFPAGQGVSINQMQTAVRSVAYLLTGDNPGVRTLSVGITVTDAEGNRSETVIRNLNIKSSNDNPVISSTETTPANAERNREIRIFDKATISDPDNNLFQRLEVEIAEGFDQDQLSLRGNLPGFTVNDEAKTIIIEGQGDANTYTRIIKSIYYEHDPFFARVSGIRKVNLRIFDTSGGSSNTLSRYFVVQPLIGSSVNIPPYLKDFQVNTDEGSSISFSSTFFTDNIVDPEDDFAGVTIESLPRHGSLFLGASEVNNQFIINNTLITRSQLNELRYQPDALYNGRDSFEWNARDQQNFAANPAAVVIQVASVNQLPQINAPASVDVEEDTPRQLNDIRVTDPDQEPLRISVSASHANLFLPASVIDRGFVEFISGSRNGDKLIIFSSSANLAAYALSGLVYAPEENFAGSDEIEINVDDNEGGDVDRTISVNVLLVNDAPELENLESTPVSYTENAPAVLLTTAISLSDEEGNQITSARISISEGYAGVEDVLGFTPQSGITGSYADGILTLSGSASAAAYQAVLRSVTYVNNSDNPSAQSRIISFSATDAGGAQSMAVNRELNVIPINDPPVLSGLEDSPISFVQNGDPVSISSSLVISDSDNPTLSSATITFDEDEFEDDEDLLEFSGNGSIQASWDEDDGVLILSGSATVAAYQQAIRNVTYRNTSDDPDDDEISITIRVSDGSAFSNEVVRSVEVITNDPPLISSFDRSINEDQPLTFALSDFPYEDPDNGPNAGIASIAITRLPGMGVLVVGEDTITTEEMEAASNGFTISAAEIDAFRYLPLPDSSGTDNFEWNAFDGAEYAESAALVNITISPQPDAPVPADFSVEAVEDQLYGFSAGQFADATRDADGDALSRVIIRSVPDNGALLLNSISIPANSELSLAELEDLQYRPAPNYNGEDAFRWAASDGERISSQNASVLISVTPVNDAPIVASFTKAINESESYTFTTADFSANYLDIENIPLSAISITSLPSVGTLLLNGNPLGAGTNITSANISQLVYQPAAEQGGGKVSFGWTASDGELMAEDEAVVTIIIGVGVTDFAISTSEDEAYSFSPAQFASNYGNPDASLQSIRIDELPENGSLLLNEEVVSIGQEISETDIALLIYQPAENFFGEDSLSWNASGGDSYADQPAKVLISVAAVNDAPVISQLSDISLLAGSSSEEITFEVNDLESEAEEIVISTFSSDNSIISADQIVISGEGSTRTLTLSAVAESQGEVLITLVASDGQAQGERQFNVTVVPYLVSLELENELNICTGESEILPVSLQGGQAPYELQAVCELQDCSLTFSDGEITFSPAASTTYFISFVDANGIRSNVDTVEVNINDCTNLTLEIPSAFTPNGDQVNDSWEIGNIEYTENVKVEVYNRYGLQVFSSEGYAEPWNGNYENTPLAAGTYYYAINVANGAQIYNGSVTILR